MTSLFHGRVVVGMKREGRLGWQGSHNESRGEARPRRGALALVASRFNARCGKAAAGHPTGYTATPQGAPDAAEDRNETKLGGTARPVRVVFRRQGDECSRQLRWRACSADRRFRRVIVGE